MRPNKNTAKQFAWAHLIALVGSLVILLMAGITRHLPPSFSGCILHDLFHVYCGFCGGTRTVEALLRLDFPTAMRCNPFVVVTLGIALVLYVIAWVRLCRGKERLVPVPEWVWIAWAVALLLYCILRNVLVIAFGIDPLGDLLPFWNGI